MATAVVCCLQNQVRDFHQTGTQTSYELVDLLESINHAGPAKYSASIPVPPPYDPTLLDGQGAWTVPFFHTFQFKCQYKNQLTKLFNILIEQKKVTLLYPFHFFFSPSM
ncbi:hypothetical protein [Echinicola sediminis]